MADIIKTAEQAQEYYDFIVSAGKKWDESHFKKYVSEITVQRWIEGSGYQAAPEVLERRTGTIEQLWWTTDGLRRWIAETDCMHELTTVDLCEIAAAEYDDFQYAFQIVDEHGEIVEGYQFDIWLSEVAAWILRGYRD